jgi:hypothetical protein
MANPEHVAILKSSVVEWNEWRESHPETVPDLTEANFENANLQRANLASADLSRSNFLLANFRDADLKKAKLVSAHFIFTNFYWADLRGADLSDAILRKASFEGARLEGASFAGADLMLADLIGTRLSEADFSDCTFGHTVIANTDLSRVKGLSKIRHFSPSSIGVDTLYHSGGALPEVFLRGAGMPDTMVRFIQDQIANVPTIQFYSCFISYSHKDEAFAQKLFTRLQGSGIRVWYAPEDMKGGRTLHDQIDQAIRLHDKLLLVLSDASILSDWVVTEIKRAWRKQGQGDQVLFPIRLIDMHTLREWTCFDADFGRDLANEVRQYFIPDFSNWQDETAFDAAFKRLLADLKASEQGK